ncbi:BLUF domain-containing protein [Maricaulis parjimensis]|uniref:BLUF domain-containing protein n=1 Tax=Maricaulis parjimensis TaxID=144023 RepID=UPI00193A5AD4|nr:BLUF domain-containing protein [Maricaulis parjimensis]
MLLSRLLYFSRRRWQGTDPADAERMLENILEAGRRNNPRDGLSGVLIVDDDLFVQVLEGPRSTLTRTFSRIQTDARHEKVVLAGLVEVGDRLFDGWNVHVRRKPGESARPPWFASPEVTTFDAFQVSIERLLCTEGETSALLSRTSKITLDFA